MQSTVTFRVPASDRAAAVAVLRGAMRVRGHRITERGDSAFVFTRGNRLATTVFGALVPPGQRYRRYEVLTSDGHDGALLTVRAAHGVAVAGGVEEATSRRRAWHLVVDGIEQALSVAGLLGAERAPVAEAV